MRVGDRVEEKDSEANKDVGVIHACTNAKQLSEAQQHEGVEKGASDAAEEKEAASPSKQSGEGKTDEDRSSAEQGFRRNRRVDGGGKGHDAGGMRAEAEASGEESSDPGALRALGVAVARVSYVHDRGEGGDGDQGGKESALVELSQQGGQGASGGADGGAGQEGVHLDEVGLHASIRVAHPEKRLCAHIRQSLAHMLHCSPTRCGDVRVPSNVLQGGIAHRRWCAC